MILSQYLYAIAPQNRIVDYNYNNTLLFIID